jgi:class 3 adenylate cyclase
VRAGLELVVAAVGALKTHTPLQTRVGISTGLVVVGDLIGSGASQAPEAYAKMMAGKARFRMVLTMA